MTPRFGTVLAIVARKLRWLYAVEFVALVLLAATGQWAAVFNVVMWNLAVTVWACVTYYTGYRDGHRAGHSAGWLEGFARSEAIHSPFPRRQS